MLPGSQRSGLTNCSQKITNYKRSQFALQEGSNPDEGVTRAFQNGSANRQCTRHL